MADRPDSIPCCTAGVCRGQQEAQQCANGHFLLRTLWCVFRREVEHISPQALEELCKATVLRLPWCLSLGSLVRTLACGFYSHPGQQLAHHDFPHGEVEES